MPRLLSWLLSPSILALLPWVVVTRGVSLQFCWVRSGCHSPQDLHQEVPGAAPSRDRQASARQGEAGDTGRTFLDPSRSRNCPRHALQHGDKPSWQRPEPGSLVAVRQGAGAWHTQRVPREFSVTLGYSRTPTARPCKHRGCWRPRSWAAP